MCRGPGHLLSPDCPFVFEDQFHSFSSRKLEGRGCRLRLFRPFAVSFVSKLKQAVVVLLPLLEQINLLPLASPAKLRCRVKNRLTSTMLDPRIRKPESEKRIKSKEPGPRKRDAYFSMLFAANSKRFERPGWALYGFATPFCTMLTIENCTAAQTTNQQRASKELPPSPRQKGQEIVEPSRNPMRFR